MTLHSVIRSAINGRKLFPDDASAMKLVYLAIQHWRQTLNCFEMEFGERINAHQ
ncbi:hypothetical protein ACO0LM_15810 [Undibacterium sp. Di26W]|uniref:hypothetical protein n=1 Tax=Undibacterium sp. Di26W TaxID=3413035 RepID=UPI003BEFEF53